MTTDTLILAYLADETQPLGLESLVVKHKISSGWKSREYATLGSDEFSLYCARDASYTRKLWAALMQELGPRARIASDIILPAKDCLDAATARGVWIDADAVAAARTRYERELGDAQAALTELAPGLNPNSPKQVLAAFRARGHRIRTTDKGALCAIGDDLARAILGVRGATKKLSTYVAPYEEASRADGRVHAQYHLYKRDMGAGGTDVFRTSSSNPNVQNLDRNLAFFAAPPGRALVKADYGTMHIRLAAWLAGERAWLDRYAENPRWDCHDWFREESRLPIDRRVAKSANFSQLYRGTGYTLVEYMAKQGVTLAPADADRVHLAWHRALPAIAPWYESVKQELLTHGYVENSVGMRRHFGRPQDVRAFSAKTFEGCYKQAVNFKVLSFEAAIAMLALGAANRAGLEVVLFVHDSIAVECDAEDVDATRVSLERAMIQEPLRLLRERFSVDLTVPLICDVEVQEAKIPA
jgi:DNA polymerase-1